MLLLMLAFGHSVVEFDISNLRSTHNPPNNRRRRRRSHNKLSHRDNR